MELDLLHITLIALIVLMGGLFLWAITLFKRRRDEAHALYWRGLVALSRAAREIDAFARDDHRTLDSLKGGMLQGLASTAHLRGLEDYRNSYVTKHAHSVRGHLNTYNTEVYELLNAMGWDPNQFRAVAEELTGEKLALKDLHGTPRGRNRS